MCMAKTIQQCLNSWGLSHVLSVTVDNASSNDVGVQHLKNWLLSRNGLILKGASIHVRCCAHILNLIVREGMKDVNESLKEKLELHLKSIYEEYSGVAMSVSNHVNQSGVVEDDEYDCSEFYDTNGCSSTEYEFARYFKEDLEQRSKGFDLLEWWKVNSSRFPILGKIAREVLAIPISTVASEAAFSTGGRVLDDYRSSLTPTMVEALICSQDWLKGASSTALTPEDLDELERIEREVFVVQEVGSSSVPLEDD